MEPEVLLREDKMEVTDGDGGSPSTAMFLKLAKTLARENRAPACFLSPEF